MASAREREFWSGLAEGAAGTDRLRVWRSLDELADSPEARALLEAEFSDRARPDGVDRRSLLRVMAASLALAGCSPAPPPLFSRPRGVPGHVPGRPMVFATTLELGGFGRGALVDTREGRPVRIDGNPLHPASLGALDAIGQAEVLSLYDPDRSRTPREQGAEREWSEVGRFFAALRSDLMAARGQGLRILSGPLTSPTTAGLAQALRETYPEALWHEYSPIADDHARQGALMAFGQPVEAVFDLARADAVLSLGCDLFLEAPGHLRYAADFAARKREARAAGVRPRLYVAETSPSITGASARERVVLRPSEVERFARAVLARLGTEAEPVDGAHPAAAAIAADLRHAGRRGLVAAGRGQPPVVHAIAHAANARLGAIGETVRLVSPPSAARQGHMESLVGLAEAIAAGSVTHLLILGGNPAYDAPADLRFADLIRRVPLSLHLSLDRDETSLACRWHLPQRHPLESWGDLRAYDGTVGLIQPATVPLVEALSVNELLSALTSEGIRDGRDLVRAHWQGERGGDFENFWLAALESGVVPDTALPAVEVRLRENWDPGAAPPVAADPQTLELTFTPDASVWDGRFANNAWLQELPRPLSKIIWGNAALIAPATAERLGLEAGDVAALSAGDVTLRVPVWPLPGQAEGTVTLPLGYGRAVAGRVGSFVGFDAYALRRSDRLWSLDGVRVSPTDERRRVISTQHHHWIAGDDIVRVVAPGAAAPPDEEAPAPSLYPEVEYPSHAWAMTIDLDACTGCNACVVACQAENNIPVVGAEEAARGRIMHWLRIDRYYAGEPGDPRTYFQPVPCMHCEKAPCEVVCPVNATVHSSEGLNEMVYNRCIGTRTCSNNCPYKVRRFNWFDYAGGGPEPLAERGNPEVTIRPRGVMEKCTYCVQRVSAARIEARLENRPIRDGEVRTACQSVCPTEAIVFGDANDPTARVTRLKQSPRHYALLGHLNTQPRTTYLAAVADEPRPGPSQDDGTAERG